VKIPGASRTATGLLEARPGDVAGRDDVLLVDVREEDELLGELGHVHGVLHVPLARLLADGLPGRVGEMDITNDTAVALVCRSGRRSAQAAASLGARGYREVYNVVGGMVRWTAEGWPVARVRTWRA
jgi:rhodanese-related sulfurtransferase